MLTLTAIHEDKKKKKGEVRKREEEELEGFSDDDTEIKKASSTVNSSCRRLGFFLKTKDTGHSLWLCPPNPVSGCLPRVFLLLSCCPLAALDAQHL